MLLQLTIDEPQHLGFLPSMQGIVDIIGISHLLLKRFGLNAITTARELCPETLVFADSRTLDEDAKEADMLFGAGAALLNVLDMASPATIEAVGERAHIWGATVILDMMAVSGQKPVLLQDLHLPPSYGYVALHGSSEQVHDMHKAGYRVALHTTGEGEEMARAIEAGPEILAISHAITQAKSPQEAALAIKDRLPASGRGWPWDNRLISTDN